MQILSMDHLVLTVKDIEVTLNFYQSVLGMRSERFENNRVALHFGTGAQAQKINLHLQGSEVEPHADRPQPGSADMCLVCDGDLATAMAHVKSYGVKIIQGPVARTGARGPIESFYLRDPDNNLIEVCHYHHD